MWTTLCLNQWVWILQVGLDVKTHGPDSLLYHVIYTQPWQKFCYHTLIKFNNRYSIE